jgi:hypothetical protein
VWEYLNFILLVLIDEVIMKTKNITESDREKLRYQILKLEYLTKRKAGQYVLIDKVNKRIIASGEQTRLDNKPKIKGNPQEVIEFLKNLNGYLEKTENLNAKRSVLTLFN